MRFLVRGKAFSVPQRITPSQNWRFIMRVSCILITVLLVSVQLLTAEPGKAQALESTRVSVGLSGASLKEAIVQIERQTNFKFAFVEANLAPFGNLHIPKRNRTVAQTLNLLLAGTDLKYLVKHNTIIIIRDDRSGLFEGESLENRPLSAPLQDGILTIKGKISDANGMPLSGVSISIKGKEEGVYSDASGIFTINAPEDGTLVFTSIGYKILEVPINKRTEIAVQLQNDIRGLNEVVVVGYGTRRKKDLTGSVAQISADELNAFPTTNVIQGLTGRAAGVQVIQNNGAPGGPISVRIRGTNSILGSNEPLYVIDGFPFSGNPTFLQNADIESIEILKDASSVAIYGSRGANGVVIITTKNGKKGGRTLVDIETSYSIQQPAKKIKLMNAEQYALLYNEQAANDGLAPYFTDDQINGFRSMKSVDWQDQVMQKAPMSNTNLSVSGGNEKTQFALSAGAFLQDGIIKNSDFDRYNLRTNLNHTISKIFSVSSSLALTRISSYRQNSGRGNRGGDLISGMMTAPPTLSPFNDDGTYRRLNTAYPFISNVLINPMTTIDKISDRIQADRILANAALTIKPMDGLSIRISGGVERSSDRTDYYSMIEPSTNSIGSASVGTSGNLSLLNENIVTYSKTFGIHALTATGGFSYQDFTSEYMNASGNGFLSDVLETANLQGAATPGIPSSGYSKWTLLSYLGRINYSLLDRYLFTVSIRRDGSSRYSPDNKWGNFPSAAFAWRVSDEKFFEPVKFMNELKLRVSYGSTGSTAISPYQTLNQLSSGKTIFGDALYNTLAPGSVLPGDLRWETTNQFDAGLDASFLENRLHFTFDYYKKITKDLLNSVQLPASMGYTSTVQNVGEIQNQGFELSLDAAVISTPDLKWNLTANLSRSVNKVLKLYGGQDILGSTFYTGAIGDHVNLLREGQPLGIFYGYKEAGYSETGNLLYEDLSKDGIISAADKTYIGNPNPDFIYGLNSTLTYKDFEFTVFLQGSQGNDIYNLNKTITLDLGMGLNLPVEVYENHWTPTNTNAAYPKISRLLNNNMSDRFVEDGSFLRFRNIQLAYNLRGEKIGAKWLRNAQLYISGQNLITFTKYSWFDPEISSFGGSNSINMGIDYFSYPTSKAITFGIRCGF